VFPTLNGASSCIYQGKQHAYFECSFNKTTRQAESPAVQGLQEAERALETPGRYPAVGSFVAVPEGLTGMNHALSCSGNSSG